MAMRPAVVFLVGTLGVLSLCSPSDGRALAIVSPLEKMSPNATQPTWSPLPYHVFMAQDEYESFQVVVYGPVDDVLSLELDALHALEFRVSRVGYLNIVNESDCYGSTGYHPDPLIPDVDDFFREKRNAFPFSVPAGENRVLWVDVFAPSSDASSLVGLSEITVVVRSVRDELAARLSVTVWPFKLPSSDPTYDTEFGLNAEAALQALYGAAWKDHTSEMLFTAQMYTRAALMNRVSLGGVLAADAAILSTHPNWTAAHEHWAPFMEGITLPFGLRNATLSSVGTVTPYCSSFTNDSAVRRPPGFTRDTLATPNTVCTDELLAKQIEYWRTLYETFDAWGWSSRLYDYTQDEPHTSDDWDELRARGKAVHEASAHLRVLCTTEMDRARAENVTALIDLWVPIINYVDSKDAACYLLHQRPEYDTCATLWWYQSCESDGCTVGCQPSDTCHTGWPSYMVDHSAIKNRVFR